jgi:hypothetical protein
MIHNTDTEMKRINVVLLFVALLTACSSQTPISTQTLRPTPIGIPADLDFSSSLVQLLNNSGLNVLSVQSSTWNGMFQSTNKAVWIKTDQGIVEAVFFADPTEAKQIQITRLSNTRAGRYIYKIQAPPSTLLHDVTIDAAFPLYFTMQHGMFLITSNAELDITLKRILSND